MPGRSDRQGLGGPKCRTLLHREPAASAESTWKGIEAWQMSLIQQRALA
jgi:hypothetical protein